MKLLTERDAWAAAPIVISVSETGLALSLEIALRARGMETVIHDAKDGLLSLPLSINSTLIVDSEVLPHDASGFLDRLRRETWRGRLIILTEDIPNSVLTRLREDGAVLIEKPFGSAELIAEVERS